MSADPEVQTELQKFISRAKFSDSAWKRRGLNPSSREICGRLEAAFNDIGSQVLTVAKTNPSPDAFKRTLSLFLKKMNSHEFDTEEREFVCDELESLARIVNVWKSSN